AISRSAEEFRDAIRTKDGVKFDAAFQKFTAECNNCHKGAGLEFIKIKVPVAAPVMTAPLSNESFVPDQDPSSPAPRSSLPPGTRAHLRGTPGATLYRVGCGTQFAAVRESGCGTSAT